MANKFGLSSMWSSATRTVTHGVSSVGNLASAADAVSQNIETSAWLSLASQAKETCEELGIESADAMQAMATINQIKTNLRGY